MATALRDTLLVLNSMQAAGVIERYAIRGAIAAFRYIEPAATEDLNISVYLPGGKSLIVDFAPITRYLETHGPSVEWRKEGLLIGAWPVQFIIASDPLDEEAVAQSETIDFDGVEVRLWRIEHLMAKCLQVGRPKDHLRLQQFLERPFDRTAFCAMMNDFSLRMKWVLYCRRFDQENICEPQP